MQQTKRLLKIIGVGILAIICTQLWLKRFAWEAPLPKDKSVCAQIEKEEAEATEEETKVDTWVKAAQHKCFRLLRKWEQKDTGDYVSNQLTRLLAASLNGDTKTVKKLIRKGASVNAIDSDPFVAACYFGHTDVVKEFIKAGVDVNVQDGAPLTEAAGNGQLDTVKELIKSGAKTDGTIALAYAAGKGHTEVVKELLRAGADVNGKGNGANPLIFAAGNNHMDIVQLLLDNGADINGIRKTGATPLALVSMNGHLDMVKKMLADGAEVNRNQGVALRVAAESGKKEIVEELLRAGAKVNLISSPDYPMSAWAAAKGHNHTDIVALLEKAGAKGDKTQRTMALISATWANDLETIQQLLKEGADINGYKKHIPLLDATAWYRDEKSLEVAKFLIQAGADPNRSVPGKDTALINVCYNKEKVSLIPLLLEAGADVNKQGREGRTAIGVLSDTEGVSVEAVKQLLKAGANPNIKNEFGGTALTLALHQENYDLVPLLIEAGADVNVETDNGNFPLLVAAARGNANTIQQLLDAGADANHQNQTKKDTALILASDNDHLEAVELLLKAGADPRLKNMRGKTALMYAKGRGYGKIVKTLEKAEKAN